MIFAERHDDGRVDLRATAPGTEWHDEDLVVVADADIDNVDDLRAAGLTVRDGATGAEIVGAAYRRWGSRACEHLLGDFAFVLWDAAAKTLCCARDHLGVRPFYIRRVGGSLRVGTVARAVAGETARPSVLGISLYIIGQLQDETLFADVETFPPACQLRESEHGSERRIFWSTRHASADTPPDDVMLEDAFTRLFRQAVACRAAPGSTAVEVSGGLDSSAVASMAASVLEGEPPLALHLAYPGMACDETSFCDAVIARHQLPLLRHDGRGTPVGHAADEHPDLIYHPTLACFDPLLAGTGERGITTVLTGVGGDQLMDEAVDECALALRDLHFTDAVRIAGLSRAPLSSGPYRTLFRRGLRPLIPEPVRRLSRRFRKQTLPHPLTASAGRRAMDHIYAQMQHDAATGPVMGMRRELTSQSLLLPVHQSERIGARHGIRFRHPFLDVRLVELMLAAPRGARLRDGVHKRKPLLRRALRHHLPDEVLQRRDAGEFSDYLRYVLQDRHEPETRALFQESRLADLGIVEPCSVREFLEGTSQTHINRLTSATGMELWLRRTWA